MPVQVFAQLYEPSLVGCILRLLLCSAYIWSGITKLLEFESTVAHFASRFKLPAPRVAVAITIIVQLGGSALITTAWMAPLGATALALFTIAATVVAYPFWTLKGIERRRSIETFLEHVGLAAALLLVVWRQ